jgi:hypothetical protein
MFTLLNTISLKDALALKKELAYTIKSLRETAKTQKTLAAAQKRVEQEFKAEKRAEKAKIAELNLQDRIAKAQLRLQKLQDKKAKPVGSKAIKANRKASKVTILQAEAAEANAIAAKFAAKKQVA